MAERSDFWDRAGRDAVLLTDGMLRADNSELMLDYGFTQDDVDWEAHFTGPEGNGFVLRFRPDLPLAGVTRAVRGGVGPLAGARVLAEDHLVVSGTAADGRAGVGERAGLGPAVRRARGSDVRPARLHPGRRRARRRPPTPSAWPPSTPRIRCTSSTTCRRSRSGSATTWPRCGSRRTARTCSPGSTSAGLAGRRTSRQTFVDPVADPTTGRIGYHLPRPAAAASLTLLEELPFAICNELPPLEEPTGL